jgi:hypothetical protein
MSDDNWWMDDPIGDYSQANKTLFQHRVQAQQRVSAALQEANQPQAHSQPKDRAWERPDNNNGGRESSSLSLPPPLPNRIPPGTERLIPNQPPLVPQLSPTGRPLVGVSDRREIPLPSSGNHSALAEQPLSSRPKRVVVFGAPYQDDDASAPSCPVDTPALNGQGLAGPSFLSNEPLSLVPPFQKNAVELTRPQPLASARDAASNLFRQQHQGDLPPLRPGESLPLVLALHGMIASSDPAYPFAIPAVLPHAGQMIFDRLQPELQHLSTKPRSRRIRLKDEDDDELKWTGTVPGPAMLRPSDRPIPLLLDAAEQERRAQEVMLRGMMTAPAATVDGDASGKAVGYFTDQGKQLQKEFHPKQLESMQSTIETGRSQGHSLLFPPPRVLEARQQHETSQSFMTSSAQRTMFQNIPPPVVSYSQPVGAPQGAVQRYAFTAAAQRLTEPLSVMSQSTTMSLLPEPAPSLQPQPLSGYSTVVVPLIPATPPSQSPPPLLPHLTANYVQPLGLDSRSALPSHSMPPAGMPPQTRCELTHTPLSPAFANPSPPTQIPPPALVGQVALSTATPAPDNEVEKYTFTKDELVVFVQSIVAQQLQLQLQQGPQRVATSPQPLQISPPSSVDVAPAGHNANGSYVLPFTVVAEGGCLPAAALQSAQLNAAATQPPLVQHAHVDATLSTTHELDADAKRAAAIARLKSRNEGVSSQLPQQKFVNPSSEVVDSASPSQQMQPPLLSMSTSLMRQQALERLLARSRDHQVTHVAGSAVEAPSPSPRAPTQQLY